MAEVRGIVDNIKKGRLLTLAVVISVSLFFIKVTQTSENVGIWGVYLKAVIYFILSYLGLWWALRFQVNKKSALYVLPQSALFVFTQVLFIDLFFFQKFGRVYEALLLLFLLLLMLLGTYVSFLTSNVFNVGSVKEIPLLQVGKTTSYILSLLMVYFLTFGLLESALHPLLILIFSGLFYVSIIFMHFRHLGIGQGSFKGKVLLTVISMLFMLTGASFVSSLHEAIAFAPMVTMFVMVGIVMRVDRNQLRIWDILEYTFLLIAACLLNIVFG